jgi:hypothetical protein
LKWVFGLIKCFFSIILKKAIFCVFSYMQLCGCCCSNKDYGYELYYQQATSVPNLISVASLSGILEGGLIFLNCCNSRTKRARTLGMRFLESLRSLVFKSLIVFKSRIRESAFTVVNVWCFNFEQDSTYWWEPWLLLFFPGLTGSSKNKNKSRFGILSFRRLSG